MRRYGHIQDFPAHLAEDLVTRPLSRTKFSTTVGKPSSYSLIQYVPAVLNQQDAGACVGFALGSGIDVICRRLGMNRPPCSKLAIYTAARSADAMTPNEPLIDDGCRPRAAMERIADGALSCLVPEDAWPFDRDLWNERLPLDVYQRSEGTKVEWFRIPGLGEERVDLVKEAIAMGYPVAFGTRLDSSFEDYDGTWLYEPLGPSIGSHMMMAGAYNPKGVDALNSWGDDHGDGGYIHFSNAGIGSARCFDFYALRGFVE